MRWLVFLASLLLLPASVSAQVAHDASCESTLTQSVSSHTCSLTASASAKGILVFTFNVNTTNDNFTGVTDGSGTPLVAVSSCSGADTAGEPGSVKAWFLGSGVTTGTQTITASRTTNTDQGYIIAISVTAGGNTQTNGCVVVQENAVPAEQNVTDGSLGTNSVRYAAAYYGLTAGNMTDGANSTRLQDASTASQSGAAWRETTAGQGSRPVGFTGVSDDLAAVYLAVRQVAAGNSAPGMSTFGVGLPRW
jgi:hypothetical protein